MQFGMEVRNIGGQRRDATILRRNDNQRSAQRLPETCNEEG